MNCPTYPNRGNPRPRGNHNNSDNSSNFNRAPPKFNNNNDAANTNTAPRTGSNAVPVAAKDKSQVTCYDCGNKGHYSNECPKKNRSPQCKCPSSVTASCLARKKVCPREFAQLQRPYFTHAC